MDAGLTIGQVARETGLRPSAIRYYERTGLLPSPARRSGRREYGAEMLTRLRLILMAKQAGFSLQEAGVLLAAIDRGAAPSQEWQALAERKLGELTALMDRLDGMRSMLRRSLDCRCLSLDDCEWVNDAATVASAAGQNGPAPDLNGR